MMVPELRDVTAGCPLRIDREGRWYYEGNEIINPLVLKAFCDALEQDPEGRFRIVIHPEVCYVEVEDTPFVVSSIRGDPKTGLYLRLNSLDTYPLEPEKLVIGEDNVLYTTLPSGMRVRFSRAAYYALALMMEEAEDGTIVLKIRDTTYPVYRPTGETPGD
ncbi:MAG: DUF1285 domain-containing protein [Desulfomonilia bacterium]|nr:DUF1285 domain-containing protein [Desulfomonilia bacterium]